MAFNQNNWNLVISTVIKISISFQNIIVRSLITSVFKAYIVTFNLIHFWPNQSKVYSQELSTWDVKREPWLRMPNPYLGSNLIMWERNTKKQILQPKTRQHSGPNTQPSPFRGFRTRWSTLHRFVRGYGSKHGLKHWRRSRPSYGESPVPC